MLVSSVRISLISTYNLKNQSSITGTDTQYEGHIADHSYGSDNLVLSKQNLQTTEMRKYEVTLNFMAGPSFHV